MRVYEVYGSAAEKRKASRGTKRGRITGKAREYLLVFDEDGVQRADPLISEPTYCALAEVIDAPAPERPRMLGVCDVAVAYVQGQCRRVSFASLPRGWQVALVNRLLDIYGSEKEMPRRYRELVRRVKRSRACTPKP